MKKISLVLFLFIFASCSTSHNGDSFSNESDYLELDYPKSSLEWNQIFSIQEKEYFVYIFSLDCYYCKEIKKDIIEFSYNCEYPIYFLQYTKDIPISYNIEETIGTNKIEETFIKGTPTLIYIKNNFVCMNVAGKSDVIKAIEQFSAF